MQALDPLYPIYMGSRSVALYVSIRGAASDSEPPQANVEALVLPNGPILSIYGHSSSLT